jgi:diguanylate cyclase (GGDEF)-like protein
VALRLKGTVRNADTVSRNGGDEFVVLLSEIAHQEHAALCADKIIGAIAAPHDVSGHKLHVTASAGVAVYPTHGASAEALLKSADVAMYQAKGRGGNAYRFFKQAGPGARSAASSAPGFGAAQLNTSSTNSAG